jgi:hypothetical protein
VRAVSGGQHSKELRGHAPHGGRRCARGQPGTPRIWPLPRHCCVPLVVCCCQHFLRLPMLFGSMLAADCVLAHQFVPTPLGWQRPKLDHPCWISDAVTWLLAS